MNKILLTLMGFCSFLIIPLQTAQAYVPQKGTDTTVTHSNYRYHTPASAISIRPRFHTNTGTPIIVDHDLTIHNLQPTLDKDINSGVHTGLIDN